jgi:chromosome segregation ATPase
MARTENTTKAIACRVPMSDYIKFLTEASNKNMTLSEWLLVKLYSSQVEKGSQNSSKSQVEAKQKEIDKLKSQIQELTRERDKLKSQPAQEELQSLRDENATLGNVIDTIYKMGKKSNISGEKISDFIYNAFPNVHFD